MTAFSLLSPSCFLWVERIQPKNNLYSVQYCQNCWVQIMSEYKANHNSTKTCYLLRNDVFVCNGHKKMQRFFSLTVPLTFWLPIEAITVEQSCTLIEKIEENWNFNEYLLMEWSETHISLKIRRYICWIFNFPQFFSNSADQR